MRSAAGRAADSTTGRNVLAGLAVATALELAIALAWPPGGLVLLLAVAGVKAWLIVVHFMHAGDLRRPAHLEQGPAA